MVDILGAISSMVALFIITALGFIATKLGFISEKNQKNISALLFNVTLPCTIIASVGSMEAESGGALIATTFILSIVFFFIISVVAEPLNILLRIPKEKRLGYRLMCVFVNVGFIGIAVAGSIFGGGAAFLGSIFLAMFNLLFYSIGVQYTLVSPSDRKEHKFNPKNLFNAPFVASAVAIVLFFSGFQLPSFLDEAISLTGAATIPLAMMLVGLNMAATDTKTVFTEWKIYPFIVIRFLVLPAIVFLVARLFITDALALGVFIVMLGMPVGAFAPVLCNIYKKDALLPTKGVIVTTLASFITIPLLLAFMAIF